MIDRYNHDYDDLIATQDEHLALWKRKLQGPIVRPISDYIRSQNKMAPTPNDKHQVFRGQDIIEIIKAWPEPEKAGYPPIPKEGADFI